MAVRTEQLLAVETSELNAFNAYTVPAGKTTIVKHVLVYCLSGGGVQRVGVFPPSGPYFPFVEDTLAPGGLLLRDLYVVMNPGDSIRLQNVSAHVHRVLVSGTELAGVSS